MIPFEPNPQVRYSLAAARKAQKWAGRGAPRPYVPRSIARTFRERVLSCPSHEIECDCVLYYRTQRRRRRRQRRKRLGARKLLHETWSEIPDHLRVKKISLKICRKFDVSYDKISRRHQDNYYLDNMRHLCLRLILQLRRINPMYRVSGRDYNSIPRDKRAIYRLSRCLSREIRRTVSPIAGQWASSYWKPQFRKDPEDYDGSSSSFDEQMLLRELEISDDDQYGHSPYDRVNTDPLRGDQKYWF